MTPVERPTWSDFMRELRRERFQRLTADQVEAAIRHVVFTEEPEAVEKRRRHLEEHDRRDE